MSSPARLAARLAWSMAGVMLVSGVLTVALGFLVLFLDDRAQVARLPPDVREEFDRLDTLSRQGDLAPEEQRRLYALLAEHPLGARPGAVVLALVAPIAVMSAAGAGIAALAARRIVAPISRVAAQARRLAEGDLHARAGPLTAPGPAGEIAGLVADFDRLGERLLASEQVLRRDAAAIAHELRTPLMVLQGRLEALADGVFAPSEEEFRRLVGQARLLGRVVEDLATLSLAQAGRLTLRLGPTDLAEAARTVAVAFEGRAAAIGVKLALALHPAPVRGDPERLLQAAAALLDNALRHGTMDGGGEVRIETEATGTGAVLRVLDRGPGVPERALVSVFEPFARGKDARGLGGDSSGLGLAVVRTVAEAHGGRARSRPRPGGGAAFEVELPLLDATQAA